jgi:ligand-binding SRPBCC domain-containing protein
MPLIELTADIAAPIERCFDLARSIDAHIRSTASTGERAVGSLATGLMALGDEVTWDARHLGLRRRLTSRITAYHRPSHFRDSQVRGAFARFDHDHFFEPLANGRTRMRDVFDYTAPFGLLGVLADRLFLAAYMRLLLVNRNRVLTDLAESSEGDRYLAQGPSSASGRLTPLH